jgi:hypothetical protein
MRTKTAGRGRWDSSAALRRRFPLLREDLALPYNRDLPGEIMFWDATDVAESLSWERNLTMLAAQLSSLGPDSGRPIPACWVIATQGLFLVAGSLAGFAHAARRHGLSAFDNSDGGLQEEGSSRRTTVRLLDRNPPQNASPRWWVEQEGEWIAWHKTRGRRRSEKPAFTPSASWPCPGPPGRDHC